MKLLNSKTYYNLAKSYAGECQAHVRYKFIEYGARKEGYTALAEIIDKIVYNEFNHARMFYTYIQKASEKPIENIEICAGYPFKEKWDLVENLRLAAEDERRESDDIYAEFEKVAREEGFLDIAELYKNIRQVENCHSMLLTDLYNQMNSGTLYKKSEPVKWKCGGCGYEHVAKEAFKICPICEAKQGVALLKLNDGCC
ncbi:MAG: rubrerythrin family protein [Clostridia bacterium]|nr:rubrerythrin family protein [Clostridia bacterium]